MDTNKIRELVDKRDQLDNEIREAVGVVEKERKAIKCSTCNEEGHTARTCSKRPPPPQP